MKSERVSRIWAIGHTSGVTVEHIMDAKKNVVHHSLPPREQQRERCAAERRDA